MKNFNLVLFLFAFLFQTIFSASENNVVTIEEFAEIKQCQSYQGNVVYGFNFYAKTEGFKADYTYFRFLLAAPDYAYAECAIPASNDQTQIIECFILASIFPLFDITKFILPKDIQIFGNTEEIYLENWSILSNKEINIVTECFVQYQYMYAVGDKEPFSLTEDELGMKMVSAQGTFSDEQYNRLGKTEVEYPVEFYAFVDTGFTPISCIIYPFSNGGEDEINCFTDGIKKVVFFPTIATSKTEVNKFVRISMYREVSLVGSFIKLTGMIFLCLLYLF